MKNGKRFRRPVLRAFSVFLLLMIFVQSQASACPVCYGNKESAEVEGARWAILFLMGVTGTVLSGVVAFVVYLRRRARLLQDEVIDVPSST
ncbi:MAG: hypothetical protein WEF53_05720 [Bacteroidota bacterium]